MNLDLAKTLYFRELDGKVQQDGRIGTYVALLSAIGGALVFVTGRVWPCPSVWLKGSLVLSLVSVPLFFVAVVWLFRATIGFGYEFLPSAEELLRHWNELSGYYEANPDTAGSAIEDFDQALLLRLTSAATKNSLNNRTRSARLHKVGQLLLAVVVLTGFAAGFIAIERVVSSSTLIGRVVMTDASKPPQPSPPAPPPAPVTPPPKPVMPQNVIVKGGAERATPAVEKLGGHPPKP